MVCNALLKNGKVKSDNSNVIAEIKERASARGINIHNHNSLHAHSLEYDRKALLYIKVMKLGKHKMSCIL